MKLFLLDTVKIQLNNSYYSHFCKLPDIMIKVDSFDDF